MDCRIDGAITCHGAAAYAELGGALLTEGGPRQECAVSLRHDAGRGQSRQIWRAVVKDVSTASLAARVEVARGAQKTDGEQSLRGLLLDRTATINLKPELEIFADDVKCAHGATVGGSEEHTSELQSLMRISYAVFCLQKKTKCEETTIT